MNLFIYFDSISFDQSLAYLWSYNLAHVKLSPEQILIINNLSNRNMGLWDYDGLKIWQILNQEKSKTTSFLSFDLYM